MIMLCVVASSDISIKDEPMSLALTDSGVHETSSETSGGGGVCGGRWQSLASSGGVDAGAGHASMPSSLTVETCAFQVASCPPSTSSSSSLSSSLLRSPNTQTTAVSAVASSKDVKG